MCALHPPCNVGKWHRDREPKVDVKELLEFEVSGAEEDLIPCVGYLVLNSVSIEGWVIHLYVYGFIDGPVEVL